MENAFSSFILGLLCTGGLFCICFLLVVGGKMVILSIKEKLFPQPIEQAEEQDPPQKSPVIKRKKRKPKTIAKPVRSIEIDPEQVDRIYVKKIS